MKTKARPAVPCGQPSPIPDRLTGFEWVMRLADCDPYRPDLADQDILWRGSREGRDLRRFMAHMFAPQFAGALLNAWKTGRLHSKKEVFLDDDGGSYRDLIAEAHPLDEPDFWLSMFAATDVAALLRQRRDSGCFIDQLLAEHPVPAITVEPSMPTTGSASGRGPVAGRLRRFDKPDRQLFPEMEKLMQEEKLSCEEAAMKLAEAGKVAGRGSNESRKRRLAALYRNEQPRQ